MTVRLLTVCSYLVLKRVQDFRGEAILTCAGAEGYELAHHALLILSIQNAQLRHWGGGGNWTRKSLVHFL